MSFGLYEDTIREAIHLLKFSGIRRLGRPLGALVAGLEFPEADAVVPVPVGRRGLRERGFNQSALIAKAVSKQRGLPLRIGLLYKCKETPPQVGLSARERLTNLRGAFDTRGRLRGERVLLIDDVMTTGATAAECSKTLLGAGAKEVYVATAARSAF